MIADPRVPHLVSLSKRHDIVINLIRKVSFVRFRRYEGILNFIRVRHFLMQNDFIKERKDFIITIHTITPVGKQYKDSAYVHVSDLSLTVIKLSYVKNVSSL